MSIKAVGYCRMSKLTPLDNISIKAQEDRIRLYCGYNVMELNKIFIDKNISGATLDRPEYVKSHTIWLM